MELIDQKTKKIMEGCKERARDAGLRFEDGTLEYIVTNRDLIELTPKFMIPTLYDYWVHDVEILKEKGRYELYPNNPYETVINTRPAISFYNDNNPDWMNVMIFYHVLAHVDFFQNNGYFRNTWDYDFTGQALSDKRLIAKLRSEKGRWVDYVIEFSRGIDNLVGFHTDLSRFDNLPQKTGSPMVDFYFDVFLQSVKKVSVSEYIKEIERYNKYIREFGKIGEQTFFTEVTTKNPEFESIAAKHLESGKGNSHNDLLQFLVNHSPFLQRPENTWMKSILELIRKTSLFFQPQIRTKIMNEGWASYWHERLFLSDDRIKGHEVDFAKTHAMVTSLPRVGLNPYALGMRLFSHIKELADKGKHSLAYKRLMDSKEREVFDTGEMKGTEFIFDIRKNIADQIFIDTFLDQDFVNKHNLFVAGKRLNRDRMVWEYYVKSRSAHEYKKMLHNNLYHPPFIEIDSERSTEAMLYLTHHFEGKPLITDFISNTMMGLEYLWGSPVQLETSEVVSVTRNGRSYSGSVPKTEKAGDEPTINWHRVVYTMKDKKLTKKEL